MRKRRKKSRRLLLLKKTKKPKKKIEAVKAHEANESVLELPKTPPEIVRDLVNHVARAFYSSEPIQVVILQLLCAKPGPLLDGQISNLTNQSYTDVVRALGKLCNELLVFHTTDQIDGKEVEKYGIKYDNFINIIKLRMYRLKQWVKDQEKEKEIGYYCIECNEGYDEYEITMLGGNMICKHDDCNGQIIEDIEEFKERTGSDIDLASEINEHLGKIYNLLEKCENFIVPELTRTNINTILTIQKANEKNRFERKLLNMKATVGKKAEIHKTFLLGDKNRIKVSIDHENLSEQQIAKSIDENTPFFLKSKDAQMPDSVKFLGFNPLTEFEKGKKMIEREKQEEEKQKFENENIVNVQSNEFHDNLRELIVGSKGKNEDVDMMDVKKEIKDEPLDDIDMDDDFMDINKKIEDEEEEEEEEELFVDDSELQDVLVYIKGVPKKFGDVTEEDEEQMTNEEYEKYCSLQAE